MKIWSRARASRGDATEPGSSVTGESRLEHHLSRRRDDLVKSVGSFTMNGFVTLGLSYGINQGERIIDVACLATCAMAVRAMKHTLDASYDIIDTKALLRNREYSKASQEHS